MTTPPKSLEERAKEYLDDGYNDFDEDEVLAYKQVVRKELQALRDEIKEKEKYHNDNFSQQGRFFMVPLDIYDLIDKRMK